MEPPNPSDRGTPDEPSYGAIHRFRKTRIAIGVAAVVIGLAMMALAFAFGDCSAFGGRCPAESPPLLDDDTFRLAAFGGAIAVGIPVWLGRPTLARLRVALAAAVFAALIVGLAARSSAAG